MIRPSKEFVTLCQSQISLLHLGLGAVWSAVYLTIRDENSLSEAQQTKLIPVLVYPMQDSLCEVEQVNLPKVWEDIQSTPRLLAAAQPEKAQTDFFSLIEQQTHWQKLQIVVPLIYQEMFMGLLVTRRNERQWNQEEIAQIEKIARTIAIASFLDNSQTSLKQELKDTETMLTIEREKLNDFLHQLRNPITALRTFSKLLLKTLLPSDRNQTVAKSMLRESERMQELVQEFEANIHQETIITPMVSGATQNFLLPEKLNLETITVKEVLEPLLVSAKAIAAEKEIELIADIPPDLPLVRVNPKALREVLNNLIDNALKYTPAGGKVYIEVGREKPTSNVTLQGISIKDTGLGIPEEDRQHIFKRHYRGVKEKGDIGGSGLGLAIAKQLMEQMDGKIELVNSETVNAGTTFIVWLPLAV